MCFSVRYESLLQGGKPTGSSEAHLLFRTSPCTTVCLLPTDTGVTVKLRLTFPYKRLWARVQTTVVERLTWRDTRWLNAEIGWNGNPREDRNFVRPGLSRSVSNLWSELEELLSAGPTAQAPSMPNPPTTGLSKLPIPWGAEGSLWGGALEKLLHFHLLPFVQTCPPLQRAWMGLHTPWRQRVRPPRRRPGSGPDPPGGGHSSPLQYSCWRTPQTEATVHWVTEGWTPLSTNPSPLHTLQLPHPSTRELHPAPGAASEGRGLVLQWPRAAQLLYHGTQLQAVAASLQAPKWPGWRLLRSTVAATEALAANADGGPASRHSLLLSRKLFMWPSRGWRSCVLHGGAGKHH